MTTTFVDNPKALPDTASPPTYSSTTEIELSTLSRSTSSSSLPPPTYDDATAATSSTTAADADTDADAASGYSPGAATVGFTPTVHFQVETSGKSWLSLPVGTAPVPIPVYRVEAGSWTPGSEPAYVSLRFSRGDGSCHLVRGGDPSRTTVCTTIYRFGPGKPPAFRLPKSSATSPTSPSASSSPSRQEGNGGEEEEHLDLQIVSKSLASRTQVLRTPHGTLQWRYGSRKERAAVPGADQLLVCELVRKVALEGGKAGEQVVARVAQLVRGRGTRSEGSGRTTAGNGGRLVVDLSRWTDAKDGSRETVETIVVASCICMLKKEVDRRRVQQMIILGAAASGGA